MATEIQATKQLRLEIKKKTCTFLQQLYWPLERSDFWSKVTDCVMGVFVLVYFGEFVESSNIFRLVWCEVSAQLV